MMVKDILRISATIALTGGASVGNMQMAIYGLPLQLMNSLSTVGTQFYQVNYNTIEVSAGDVGGTSNLVFVGMIHDAYVDGSNQPQVCFRITAIPGGAFFAVKPVPPISKSGPQDVAQMMQQLAGQMKLQFENNGVNVKLTNPYYGGSPWNQAFLMAQHAGIELFVDRGTLAICPQGQSRSTGGTPLVAPPDMVGYPAFTQAQIFVRSLAFHPVVTAGGSFRVQSSLTPACGTWGPIMPLTFELDSAMPHGRWFQSMTAVAGGGMGPGGS